MNPPTVPELLAQTELQRDQIETQARMIAALRAELDEMRSRPARPRQPRAPRRMTPRERERACRVWAAVSATPAATRAELAQATGIPSTATIYRYLCKLRELGYIDWPRWTARTRTVKVFFGTLDLEAEPAAVEVELRRAA